MAKKSGKVKSRYAKGLLRSIGVGYLPAELAGRRDCALIDPPSGIRQHSKPELLTIVRLLALSTSKTEREVVCLCLFHRLAVDAVADRLDLPTMRASELLQSLRLRVEKAGTINRSEALLAQAKGL